MPGEKLVRIVVLLLGSVVGGPLLRAEIHDHGASPEVVGKVWAQEMVTLAAEDRANLIRVAGELNPEDWKALTPGRKRQLLSYVKNRFDGERPLSICWKDGTPMTVIGAFHAVEEASRSHRPRRVGAANQIGGHWGTTANGGGGQNAQGQPVTLTWSFLPDGTAIPSAFAGDSSDPSNFLAWIVGLYGGNAALPPDDPVNAAWFSLFEDMFASYASKTGLRYVYEANDDGAIFPNAPGSNGVRGDVRIGGHMIDANGDGSGSVLAYNYFPDTGDMVIDTADDWFAGTGRNNDSRGMRNVLEHEHGHGLGLEHVCPVNQTKLMEPFVSTAFLGVQFDDQYSASRNYGDFYERSGVQTNNDSFANASDLALAAGVQFGFQWVSIDDNTDVDYYSFATPGGGEVTARVIPSTQSYQEGEQNPMTGSCGVGMNFNSNLQHDLTLELIGPSENVLATASANGLGSLEEIVSFSVPTAGTHYLRVTGGSSDSSQMYRLEVLVEIPAVALAVQSYGISLESMLPANGVVDPGETVAVTVDVENLGAAAGTNVQGALSGPAGFTGFTAMHSYGTLAAGGSGSGTFVFGLEGDFGDVVNLDFQLTADGGQSQTTPLSFTLGQELFVLKEEFGNGDPFPGDWTRTATGGGSNWSLSPLGGETFLYAVDEGSAGTSVLTSPQVTVSGTSAELMFVHRYAMESGRDGGVLEVSVDGGAWSDILVAGGIFLENGYTGTLGSGRQNPLPNRAAWTGLGSGFVTTRVSLPAGLLNVPVQFRWVLGHDVNGSNEGWFLDTVMLSSGAFEVLGVPQLDLSVVDGTAAEFGGLDTAEVQVVTPLPLLAATPLTLIAGGSATPGSDVTGLGLTSLPAGKTAEPIVLSAVSDGEVEGPEQLTLDLGPSSEFLVGMNGQAVVNLEDTPYGQWAFSNLGGGLLSGPLEDKDGDRFENGFEYAWGTNGDAAGDFPDPVVFEDGGLLKISAPLGALPPDVFIFAEQSDNLSIWSSAGMQTLADAFGFPLGGDRQFLRIGVQILP